jgi:hypothetical protein
MLAFFLCAFCCCITLRNFAGNKKLISPFSLCMIKIVLSFFLLMCCFSLLYAQPNLPPFAVVELYTSQGCNRCPQADSVLKKIADEAKQKSKNILTIALPC